MNIVVGAAKGIHYPANPPYQRDADQNEAGNRGGVGEGQPVTDYMNGSGGIPPINAHIAISNANQVRKVSANLVRRDAQRI